MYSGQQSSCSSPKLGVSALETSVQFKRAEIVHHLLTAYYASAADDEYSKSLCLCTSAVAPDFTPLQPRTGTFRHGALCVCAHASCGT